ncbi:MAG: zinc ribbon domain-containing protein [Actinomycetota bacterium]
MKGVERILELQELDVTINRLEARRRELESGDEVNEARRVMEQAEGTVGELRLALDSVASEERRLENEIASLDARSEAEQRRLYDGTVANPKELSSIQAEIESIRRRKSRLEDEELDQMERRENLEGQIPALEAQMAEARREAEEAETSSGRELEEIERTVARHREQRTRLASELDEEVLELYEDLRAGKRGIGAAALRDGVCQGCHEKLSALELDRLKREQGLRRCPHCRRILVPD